jgi:tryptophan synthase alpha chain
MKSKIDLAFEKCRQEKRPALITYTVAGDNTKSNSLKILNKISKHADILELGFPHNTPIADGGQIQESSHRALKNGIKLKDVFQIVKKFKKSKPNKPLILMGYFNLIYQRGEDNFLRNCKNSGVD